MTSPAGDVQIVNMALARIGSTQVITDFAHDGSSTTDVSNEAAQATVWFTQCRDALLVDFAWPWTSKYAALTLLTDITTGVPANQEWRYAYRYPPDCLSALLLLYSPQSPISPPLTTVPSTTINDPQPWNRQDGNPYPIPFEIGYDDTAKVIYTDLYGANLKYTRVVTDPTQFPADFANLLAWRLAVEFSYALAISDARRKVAQEMYMSVLMSTRANTLNEAQRDNPYVSYNSEFVRARYGG